MRRCSGQVVSLRRKNSPNHVDQVDGLFTIYEVINDTLLDWLEAEEDCQNRSGHLVSVLSDPEGNILLKMLPNKDAKLWTGAKFLKNTQRTCTLQRLPVHEDRFGNEQADNFDKEARNSPQLSNRLTLTNADAIFRCIFTSHPVKKNCIPDLNCDRVISTTIARLRTRHLKGMKISPDDQRRYNTYPQCPDIQLPPNHIFNGPSVLVKRCWKAKILFL
ncbi:c-type lectin domain-containing protein [Trichonephila clavipes]|nr:c-type lectin domain-containing protein [Trichonephila clavipes]